MTAGDETQQIWCFCDNEGCLVPGKGLAFELLKIEKIQKFLAGASGVRFSLATGRSVPYVEAMMQVLGLSDAAYPSVCEAGASLYWPARDVWELVRSSAVEAELIAHIPVNQYRLELGKVGCLTLYPNSPSTITSLYDVVCSSPLASQYSIRTSSAAVDITPLGVDKGLGIKVACERMEHPLRHTIAIGDSNNDLPMFGVAQLFAAPNNATPEIKARAHYVSKYSSSEGVLDILERLVSGRLVGN